MRNNFNKNFILTYSIATDSWSEFRDQPFIVMQNLFEEGCTQLQNKLELENLMRCIKLLAWFHGNMYRLESEKSENYMNFLAAIVCSIQNQKKRKRRMNIR